MAVAEGTEGSGAATLAELAVPHLDELFIGGEWRTPQAEKRGAVVFPATAETVAEVTAPTVADADAAGDAAAVAFAAEWPRMPVAQRVEIVAKFCESLEKESDRIGAVWAVEAGVPIRWSKTLHRFAARAAWRGALEVAETALAPENRQTPVGEVVIEREPVGPVLAIMPYNGPLATIGSKVIPALLAGASVVVKTAPESALMMRIVSECAREAGFPPGVLSILAGDLEVSRHLVRDPRFELISLTGGPRAAADILRQSADSLPRTIFELGGKSPAVLLEDVDLERAMTPLVAGAMSGSGQVCAALSRILVPAARHDEVVDAVAAAYDALTIGDPRSPQTDHGPLANAGALERTEKFVEGARSAGAEAAAGGRRPEGFGAGWYYEPTLLVGVGAEDDVVREEVFGPVTAVLSYESEEEAVALANDTDYGLAASVFSADRERALGVARQIRSGSVALNAFGPTMSAPFGGFKRSGWGRECGPEGILAFTDTKQVLLG